MDTWKIITESAKRRGVKADTIAKWRQRHVPFRYRLQIVRDAAQIGVVLSDGDFIFRGKKNENESMVG